MQEGIRIQVARNPPMAGVRINVGELSCLVIGANFAESIALKSGMDVSPFQSLPIGLPMESEVNYST